jgi:hypothetical protein
MALRRNEGQHPHIPFAKEPGIEPQRRGKRKFETRATPPVDRRQHAESINQQLAASVDAIRQTRVIAGIDPARLLVLEFGSLGFELDESFAERFGSQIVDEREEKFGNVKRYRAVLQFASVEAIERFQREIAAYQTDDPRTQLLPPGQRRDFLDGLREIRGLTRDDRMGDRLRSEGWPRVEPFMLDVDLWHPGDALRGREIVQQLRGLCQTNGGRVADDLRTSSLLLLKIQCGRELGEMLLALDLVARVDLPPLVSMAFSNLTRDINWPNPTELPDDDDPIACVVDSGVIAGHPLLANWVIEERDFDSGEDSPADLNGHGTAVAGLVVYGDVSACIETNVWQPRVRICSAKVLRNRPNPVAPDRPEAVFPEESEKRIETVVEEAIRYFHNHGVRIFNLSVGDRTKIYADQRQFSWAELLDGLSRELDIVVVISIGNHDPEIPDAPLSWDRFRKAVRDQTLNNRLISPATAVLSLTVGSLARSDGLPDGAVSMTAGAPAGGPSPFTRAGPGYALRPTSRGIKPELADYGGNYALQAMTPDTKRWFDHPALGEPSLQRDYVTRAVRMFFGTSYAAPHVTHAAAVAQVALREALGQEPSGNLIRAVLGATASVPDAPRGWYSDEENRLRMIGYGRLGLVRLPWSVENDSRLIAMDEVEENKFHLYRIPVPLDFLTVDGRRGITIALAYDPPVRGSRKEYMARTMFFQPIVGLTIEQAQVMLSKFNGARDEEPRLPPDGVLGMTPGPRRVAYSTLQVRRADWVPGEPLPVMTDPNGDAALTVAVFCQRRFAFDPLDAKQKYGLVVDFWHEAHHVRLYQALRNRVRQRVRQQVRR